MKEIYKEDHPDIAMSLNNIGWVYSLKGDNKMAFENYFKSLLI